MSTTTFAQAATPAAPVQVRRAARALIGWMRSEDAAAALAGVRSSVDDTTVLAAVAAEARNAVASRVAGVDQHHAIAPIPPELSAHSNKWVCPMPQAKLPTT